LSLVDRDLCWLLLYTKPRAEGWAEINLRKQGFHTLLPRVRQPGGFAPLFPRYLFVGFTPDIDTRSLRSTRGVLYIVTCGDHPARVPPEVVLGVSERMDAHGVVQLDGPRAHNALFSRRERERVRMLVRFAQAGFRVVA
jgi:hypothetical protein